MKQTLSLLVLLGLGAAGFAGEFEPIENSMKFTHKAPKGEKKVSDRIIEGTNSPEELAKTLELYKLMLDCKPPKGEQAAFKEKVTKLIAATEDVVLNKEGARAAYKEASNCKACHNEHKEKKPEAPKPEAPAP